MHIYHVCILRFTDVDPPSVDFEVEKQYDLIPIRNWKARQVFDLFTCWYLLVAVSNCHQIIIASPASNCS